MQYRREMIFKSSVLLCKWLIQSNNEYYTRFSPKVYSCKNMFFNLQELSNFDHDIEALILSTEWNVVDHLLSVNGHNYRKNVTFFIMISSLLP